MIVKCNKRCFDSKRCILYVPGDQDDINPLDPISMYFDFPPGTVVYHKYLDKKKKWVYTTNVVPGKVAPPPEPEPTPVLEPDVDLEIYAPPEKEE